MRKIIDILYFVFFGSFISAILLSNNYFTLPIFGTIFYIVSILLFILQAIEFLQYMMSKEKLPKFDNKRLLLLVGCLVLFIFEPWIAGSVGDFMRLIRGE